MDPGHTELKRAGSFNRGSGGGGSVAMAEQEQADFLAIEDLLDFSNEDIAGSIESADSHESAPASSTVLSCCDDLKGSCVSSAASERPVPKQQQQEFNVFEDVGGSGELCTPYDDIEGLEWLSNFIEESFWPADGAVPDGILLHDNEKGFRVCESSSSKQGPGPRASPTSVLDHNHGSTTINGNKMGGCAHLHVSPDQIYLSWPGRARSKRRRTDVCFWNTRILSITDDCYNLEASSTSKLTSQHQSSSSSSESEGAMGYNEPDDFFQSPATKPPYSSKLLKGITGNKGHNTHVKGSHQQAASGDRRCLHCGSQRTPQWRAGPMGPKTLCNACGVRFKSGRLLPEYRPAASPTFVESIHSNSHRRVLEMRRQRGDAVFATTTSGHVDQLGVC